MTSALSPNTEAILLLTAPLIAVKGEPSEDLLTPGQYTRLVRHLQDNNLTPADLVSTDGAEAVRTCEQVVEADRLERLLARGFLLAQALERWTSKSIWVVSRSDPEYPRILKSRLKNDAPAVLYGCGDPVELNSGGLAVVGSRHVDDELLEYTQAVGSLAARSGRTIVSGGAKGIDQAAMHGALDAGGRAAGVLADSLEKAVLARYNRDMILTKQLTLVSPYDPAAGFNVGNAMRRNKYIYALSNASLVVSSDVEKGGTWTGAVEQLTKLKLVSVYVRSTGPESKGLNALTQRGARPWPNPAGVEDFQTLIDSADANTEEVQPGLPFPEAKASLANGRVEQIDGAAPESTSDSVAVAPKFTTPASTPEAAHPDQTSDETSNRLQDQLFDTAREVIRIVASSPTSIRGISAKLGIMDAQVELWVKRLLKEGVLETGPNEDSLITKAKGASTG